MENFITWENMLNYTTFVGILYMVVEFTKDIPFIKQIPTKYWSCILSIIMIIITNLVTGTFDYKDILLYLLTSISISLGANGLSNFNSIKESEEEK